jgi:hypothetical protein
VTQGISAILTFAIGVAVSPVPIIAVILMLFSRRARVNGPLFLLGWVVALAVVSGVAYYLADAGGASTSSTATSSIEWGKVVLGVLLLLAAARNWRSQPAPGEEPEMPKWMAGIDDLTPPKALGLGLLLAGVNPKNLILTIGAATSVAQLGLSTTDAVVSLLAFVVLASVTIAVPVVYYLVGGDGAAAALDRLKDWLRFHNAAVMATLLLIFGVDLIAQGLPGL